MSIAIRASFSGGPSLLRASNGFFQELCSASMAPAAIRSVELQTNFGGGKTHALLALYHLFSGAQAPELPGVEEIIQLTETGRIPAAKRVVLNGRDIPPGQARKKPDGTLVRTLWGSSRGSSVGRKVTNLLLMPIRPAPARAMGLSSYSRGMPPASSSSTNGSSMPGSYTMSRGCLADRSKLTSVSRKRSPRPPKLSQRPSSCSRSQLVTSR